MRQNKYDDPAFFSKYGQMARSVDGLAAAGEWPAFCAMLPDLAGTRVLDLGCGFGWHCRFAREQHARHVVGVDLSANMLDRARADTHHDAIEFRRMAIEEIDCGPNAFDVVLSSLALHYVRDFDDICRRVHHLLAPGGRFVFSVQHPVFTAHAAQDWCYGPEGERRHWMLDRDQDEGVRRTAFLGEDVIKYHRTLATYVDALIQAGFAVREVRESTATAEMLAADPELRDESRRPMFLLVAADR